MASKPRKYSWLPDLPDPRDLLFQGMVAPGPHVAALPSAVDLRRNCSRIENQGAIGSCTANALAGALEFLEKKAELPYVEFSRLFIYYEERELRGSVDSDSGAMLRDGIKVLKNFGACDEKIWSYGEKNLFQRPSAEAYRDALEHQILSYHRILNLNEMKLCLAQGFPFVFGFSVFSGFESEKVAQTGRLELPDSSEKLMGGHAVMAVGYHDLESRLIVRNSWGKGWGMDGYFTMPYEYVESRNLSDDFWTIRKLENSAT